MIIPTRTIRESRKEIQKGSGLGSMVTVDAAIEHLIQTGLLKVDRAVGSASGNEYEVFTPEEVMETYTSIPSSTSPIQNLVYLDIPDSGISGITQSIENKAAYNAPKTIFKTNTTDDDSAFAEMARKLEAATEKPTGKKPSARDVAKCGELADLLILELEVAASRTEKVSNVPAFLTEILRRQFFASRQNTRQNEKSSVGASKIKTDTVGKSNDETYEIKPLDAAGREAALADLREFAAEDFLSDFKKWYTEADWQWLSAELGKNAKTDQSLKTEPESEIQELQKTP